MMANSYCTQLRRIQAKRWRDPEKPRMKTENGKRHHRHKVSDTPDRNGTGGGDKASAETIEMVSESDYNRRQSQKFNYEFRRPRRGVFQEGQERKDAAY